jgi:hypothetical protein
LKAHCAFCRSKDKAFLQFSNECGLKGLMQILKLPDALKTFAQRELMNESVLWVGKPENVHSALPLFAIWVFAIPWTVFALFWEAMVAGPLIFFWLGWPVGGKPPGSMGMGMMAVMALFGLPFILIGFGMLASPFYAMRRLRRTGYVLTDKRLAILTDSRSIGVKSYQLRQIHSVTRLEHANNTGTVTVGLGFTRDSDGDRQESTEVLANVSDARRLEQLLLEIVARQKTR